MVPPALPTRSTPPTSPRGIILDAAVRLTAFTVLLEQGPRAGSSDSSRDTSSRDTSSKRDKRLVRVSLTPLAIQLCVRDDFAVLLEVTCDSAELVDAQYVHFIYNLYIIYI